MDGEGCRVAPRPRLAVSASAATVAATSLRGAHRAWWSDECAPRREVVRVTEDPQQRKAPIDWAKWFAALGSIVGAIAAVVRSLRGD